MVGATGYSGFELTRLLNAHPRAKKPLLLKRAEDTASADLAECYPHLSGNGGFPLEPFSWTRVKNAGVDVLFLCTPHEVSRAWVPEALELGLRVVDLSGAWRLKQAAHRGVYGFEDSSCQRTAEINDAAVYGSPELHAAKMPGAALVANPGCYATSIILALTPWLRDGLMDRSAAIVCDAKSGVSGAGKQPTPRTHFVEVSENLSAYTVFGHRHTGEILEQLDLGGDQLQFTPHLLPIPRGILSTIYARVAPDVSAAELEESLRRFYAGRKFVRIFAAGALPEIKYSLHTNFCDLGFCLEPNGQRVVLISCLDNLIKGAAGQAVQNMNLMFGWSESEGLA